MGLVSLIFFVTVFNVLVKLVFFWKYSGDVFLSTFIWHEMGAMRFAIATSFFFIVVDFWMRKKRLSVGTTTLISSSFHNVSLVNVGIPFLDSVSLPKRGILTLLFLFSFLFVLEYEILNRVFGLFASASPNYGAKFLDYVNNEPTAKVELGFLLRVLVILFLLTVSSNYEFKKNLIFKLYILSFFVYIVFRESNFLAQRLSVYFASFEPVVVPALLTRFRSSARVALTFVIILLYMFRLLRYVVIYTDATNTWLPYTTILSTDYFF